jgi:hypothetical protein
MKKKLESPVLLIFILLACVVLGTYVGEAFVALAESNETFRFLRFLGEGYTFGLTSPVTLDLIAIAVTLGLAVKFSICSILFMILGVVIYRKL